jgi:DNA-binding transcriptional LysR family regulator
LDIDLIRSFFAVVAHGSLNKAATHLRVSQSTLTRQMQQLEQAVGGALLERGSAGVALTATGHALHAGMAPVLLDYDRVLAQARRRARGQSAELRIGYLASAADFLHPALTALRKTHPEIKVQLLDLSPGEQITALRAGTLDVALIGHAGALFAKEFYLRKLAALPLLVALAADHPRARAARIALRDLAPEVFVGAREADMPGHNAWITQLCKRAGFRARFIQDAESLTHGLSLTVTDGAVSLLPHYIAKTKVPGVVFRPLKDATATWDLFIAWQRGKAPAPLKTFLAALPANSR